MGRFYDKVQHLALYFLLPAASGKLPSDLLCFFNVLFYSVQIDHLGSVIWFCCCISYPWRCKPFPLAWLSTFPCSSLCDITSTTLNLLIYLTMRLVRYKYVK